MSLAFLPFFLTPADFHLLSGMFFIFCSALHFYGVAISSKFLENFDRISSNCFSCSPLPLPFFLHPQNSVIFRVDVRQIQANKLFSSHFSFTSDKQARRARKSVRNYWREKWKLKGNELSVGRLFIKNWQFLCDWGPDYEPRLPRGRNKNRNA